jgi:fructose-1,6-bisphosphatase I
MRADHCTGVTGVTASLSATLAGWACRGPERAPLADVVGAIAGAGVRLSTIVAISPLKSALRPDTLAAPATAAPESAAPESVAPTVPAGSGVNPSGDQQKPLDLFAEKLFVDALAGLDVAAVCSEETGEPIPVTAGGRFVVTLDPLDGSSNIDTNAPIGTIFSILPALGPQADPEAALLQPGRRQLAAGVILYGPATVLALTLGEGTDLYVLDPRTRDFRVINRRIAVPAESGEYAINASNARHWGPGIAEYVRDLVSGALGPRERDFNMRWLASLAGDVYRILVRGGIFLYPADARPGYREGRIRLVYEANPVAMLCEQAGGLATDGVTEILDLEPVDLHQRVPLVFGSRNKVARVRRYLLEPQTAHEHFPLFSTRGLFRT